MNYKKFLTAFFYTLQTPFAVWAGIEFADNSMLMAWGLIAVMMVLEAVAVFYWMDAQSSQTADEIVKRQNGKAIEK